MIILHNRGIFPLPPIMNKPNAASLIVFGFSLGLFASANAGTLGSSAFPDVPGGTYYDGAVGDMYAAGIITGYSDGKFGPNDYVTRGQVAVMMQRFKAHLTGQNITVSSSSRRTVSSSSSSSSSSVSSTAANPAGSFRFTTGSYKADEDKGEVLINIIRYGGNTGVVSVEYETSNGTADAGSDYNSVSGKMTIPDGKTTGSFIIPITDDNESEDNESVTLRIKNPTGGALLGSPAVATLTIVDNDTGDGSSANDVNSNGVFEFSASEYEVIEDGDTITITVERTGTSGSTSVKYEATNGSADSEYYNTTSGTLEFPAGTAKQSFDITIKDNNKTNGNKTVDLKISDPTGGAELGSLSTASLVIVDDEVSSFGNGNIKLMSDKYDTSEGESIRIVIDRIRGADGEVSVDYKTTNALAKSDADYIETSGTLVFRDGESQKSIGIPILSDTFNDPRETFWFEISNPTGGATLDAVKKTTITIQ
jgi:hypothetical protein